MTFFFISFVLNDVVRESIVGKQQDCYEESFLLREEYSPMYPLFMPSTCKL